MPKYKSQAFSACKLFFILFFIFSFAITAFTQKKANPKIGKKEVEINSFFLDDNHLAIGAEVIYRFVTKKKVKFGAGCLYAPGFNFHTAAGDQSGYGAALTDVLFFIGQREKWSIGSQLGYGFYKQKYTPSIKIKGGIYYAISTNYRAIISKKLLLTISIYFGKRTFHYEDGTQYDYGIATVAPIGIKLGVVF